MRVRTLGRGSTGRQPQRLAVQEGEPGGAPWARLALVPRPLAARPSSRARASRVVLMAISSGCLHSRRGGLVGIGRPGGAPPMARRSPARASGRCAPRGFHVKLRSLRGGQWHTAAGRHSRPVAEVRRGMAEADVTALCFEGFTLDPAAHTLVDASGCEVALRRSEYELLRAFLAAPGRALSRDHLLDAVAGRG